MDMWQILGIPFTHDEKEIRRAYAKQLKNIDPILIQKSISS
ncbi:hypothetical protein AB6F62_07670 [Providencia huaxiensis]